MTTIRSIHADDWRGYKALYLEAIRLHPEVFDTTLEAEESKRNEQWQRQVETGARSADGVILVADNDCQLVGIIGVVRLRDKRRHIAQIRGMYVQADYRNQHLDSALMQEALGWARRQDGLEKLQVRVSVANEPAHKLYSLYGFKETETLLEASPVNAQPVILMELRLTGKT